jgi:PAS domain S-box-containing protein
MVEEESTAKHRTVNVEQHWFRTIADYTYDWEYWIDPQGHLLYVSPACERITGYGPEAFMADSTLLATIVHPDDRAIIERHLHHLSDSAPFSTEFRIRTRDGQERWIGHACQAVYDGAGEWLGRRASNRDITEAARVAAELRHTEQTLRALIDAFPDRAILIDVEGTIQAINASAAEILGTTPERARGTNLYPLLPDEVSEDRRRRMASVIRTGEPTHYETRIANYTFRVTITPIQGERGQVTSVAIFGHDVTEQRRAEEALRASEWRFRSLIESSHDHIFMLSSEGVYLSSNGRSGYLSPEDHRNLVGKHLRDIYPPEIADMYQEKVRQAFDAEEVVRFEHPLPQADGLHYHVDTLYPIREGTEVWAVGGICRDITERKLVEQEQEHVIKELDAFAHTVAHDLKNQLSYVVGFAEVLVAEYADLDPATVRDSLTTIAGSARKMARIIDALLLLASARQMEIETHGLDMGAVVDQARERVAPLIERTGATLTLPARWPRAVGHAPWVEEVWVNYLSNALKYGGDPPHVVLGAHAEAEQVRFWIRDDGTGLTPEQQARLFTPFTQFSERRQGHGLGLSIVKRIVERLDGRVGVESAVGQGSTFYFTLPAGVAEEA